MKALVFAAGLGTRLRPLTNDRPKALVEVAGEPMLQHVILNLKKYGFDDITVNIHHFGQMIIDFLEANNNFGVNIHISDERNLLLDTGGGIKNARRFLDGNEPFLVHNADILTDLDLKHFYDVHISAKADVSVLTAKRETSRYLIFDKNNTLCGWTNIKTGETIPNGFIFDEDKYTKLAFGGLHVISPSIFKALEEYTDKEVFPIVPFYVASCHKYNIHSYNPSHYNWLDIGKPETLSKAEELFK